MKTAHIVDIRAWFRGPKYSRVGQGFTADHR